jgi:hypothetical protein
MHIKSRAFQFVTALAIAAGTLSCESSTPSDTTREPADVQPVAIDSVGAPLTVDSASFWAVAGKDRRLEIRLSDGTQLLRFDVKKNSLARYPDGTPFDKGDSVLIRVSITDRNALSFDFEPSGLRFSGWEPAELRVSYSRASLDEASESQLAIWMQETASSPFLRLWTKVDTGKQELEAAIPGFSKYAVAY